MDVGDAVGGKEAATASVSGRSHDGGGVYSRGEELCLVSGGFFGACVGLEIVIGNQVRACHTWIDSLTIPGGNLNLLPCSIFPELWPYHTWIDSLWGNLNLLPYNYHIQNFLSYDLTIPGLIYYYTWINYD